MIEINKRIYFNREEELTVPKVAKIIRYFQQSVLPSLARNRGYYDGTGQEIMRREMADPTKPNNRIVKNYCKTIVENFRGYIAGQPITYQAAEGAEEITKLLECFKDNSVITSDSEWLKNALVYGTAPQLCYINERNEKRFKNVSPEQVIPVYSADLDEELIYAIYFYPIVDWGDVSNLKYHVSVYDNYTVRHFQADSSFASFIPTGEEEHYFGTVPFAIFDLNDDGTSVFECITGLQDAYNKLISDSVNDWEAFVDAYLVLTNVEADSEDLAAMKESRTIMLDDDSTASYLTKPTGDTHIKTLLDEVNVAIHTIANSPDFSSEEFGSGVSSGIALQFKLVGFNNIASNIEAQFRKAIQRKVDVLNSVFYKIDGEVFDLEITFTHNLPQNIQDTAQTINMLRNLVSDETLLAQIPFIHNVQAELEKVRMQSPLAQDPYDFTGGLDGTA